MTISLQIAGNWLYCFILYVCVSVSLFIVQTLCYRLFFLSFSKSIFFGQLISMSSIQWNRWHNKKNISPLWMSVYVCVIKFVRGKITNLYCTFDNIKKWNKTNSTRLKTQFKISKKNFLRKILAFNLFHFA